MESSLMLCLSLSGQKSSGHILCLDAIVGVGSTWPTLTSGEVTILCPDAVVGGVSSTWPTLTFDFLVEHYHHVAVAHLEVSNSIHNFTVLWGHCFVTPDESACNPILGVPQLTCHLQKKSLYS